MIGELLLNNANDFRVKGFRDTRAASGTYLNAATTATWEIRTAKSGGGTQIASGTMTYVTSSNGEYVGGPSGSAISSLVEDTEYWVRIILIEGSVRADWDFPMTAVRRIGTGPNR